MKRFILAAAVMAGATVLTACSDTSRDVFAPQFSGHHLTPQGNCLDVGDWVWDGTSWSLTGPNDLGSKKFDTTGDPATVIITAPTGYLISGYCVKAGPGDALWIPVSPAQATVEVDHPTVNSVSHFALEFVLDPDTPLVDPEWCSPGFWRANATNWGASAWPVPTNTLYNGNVNVAPVNGPTAGGNPTLLQVLNKPGDYFPRNQQGAGFNAVGHYLSIQHGDVDFEMPFDPNQTYVCPLSQTGN